MKRLSVAAALALVAIVAFATTYGPFHVSALGPSYAQTTFDEDEGAEFTAANRAASLYLSPILNTPAKIAKAIESDYIRIVYYDGQIADFKISRWPSSIPVDFSKKVSSATFRDPSEYDTQLACLNSGGASSFEVPTGYWGSNSVVTGPNQITTTAYWVDTGYITLYQSGPPQTHCTNAL